MTPSVDLIGDAALVVTFGATLSADANARVHMLAASLRDEPLPASAGIVRDIVPAMVSLTLHVQPGAAATLADALLERAHVVSTARAHDDLAGDRAIHEIPVVYGGAGGPDLEAVAAFAGCSPGEVVARHSAGVYRVYMLGFLPGFAYLGDVEPSIAAPRRSTPRTAVPAGSVGIAGRQTGIYPQPSPGGWQLIGQTRVSMFDAVRGAVLQPGDRVRFVVESIE